jgi:hypothetical protein
MMTALFEPSASAKQLTRASSEHEAKIELIKEASTWHASNPSRRPM